MNLTRTAIVTTALNLLDTYGLPDMSMRRIASVLSVQPSALYWYFDSKQELLAAVADAILEDLPRFHGGDLTRLRLWAARLHALLMNHRNGAELVWSVLCLTPWESGIGFQVEEELTQSGLSPAASRTAAQGILHLVLGHAFDDDQRQQAAQLNLAPGPSPDSPKDLDDMVAVFVAGIEAHSW